jgi:hypothetical protein
MIVEDYPVGDDVCRRQRRGAEQRGRKQRRCETKRSFFVHRFWVLVLWKLSREAAPRRVTSASRIEASAFG